MDKRTKTLLYILSGVILLVMVLEINAPKPLNWSESYTSADKIPYGCYVLFNELPESFDQEITSVAQDPVSFLKANKETTNSNYIFINNYIGFDKQETELLIDYASRGNKVFVASKSVYGELADSLKLKGNETYQYYQNDTVRTRVANPVFKNRSYIYEKGSEYKYFTSYDTLTTTVLGEVLPFEPVKGYLKKVLGDQAFSDAQDTIADKTFLDRIVEKSKNRQTPQVNYIEIKVGDGAIYYSLNPIAYTNFCMLERDNAQYVANTLSYLNDGPIYFDDYGKSGRKVITTPLRFILQNKHLKWAWYLTLATILIYFIFKSRREQRIIKVIEPLENSTIEFTKTIGDLYFQSGDYDTIIDKKITYFLEHVRSTYHLNTQKLDDKFKHKLAVKSSNSREDTNALVDTILFLRSQNDFNEYQLLDLHKKIQQFTTK